MMPCYCPGGSLAGVEEQQNTRIATSVAAAGVSAAASAGLISATVAGPVGLAIAAVGLLVTFLFQTSKEGKQKIAATQIVNQGEELMKKNIAAWEKEPHTRANQAAALANFDNIWAQIVQACGSGQLEAAGERCISERSPGGKWDYFAYYRDPIANTATIDSSPSAAVIVKQAAGSVGLSALELAAIAAVLVLVVVL